MLPGGRRPNRSSRLPHWAGLIICVQLVGLLWLCGVWGKADAPPVDFAEQGSDADTDSEPRDAHGSLLTADAAASPSASVAAVRASALAGMASGVRMRWRPESACAVDRQAVAPGADLALGGSAGHSGAGERFLVYSPQFGLSNQLVALRNAAAWASLLNRTLVIPHLVTGPTHAASVSLARHGAIFDVLTAARRLAPALRVVEMRDFLPLKLTPDRLVLLSTNTRFSTPSYDYLDTLGLSSWHADPAAPPLPIMVAHFMPGDVRASFGGCGHHRVLAFASLFGAFDPKPLSWSPPDWLVPAAFGSQVRMCHTHIYARAHTHIHTHTHIYIYIYIYIYIHIYIYI